MNRPPRITDIELYWIKPPPEPSPRCQDWVKRIEEGWRMGGSIAREDYYSKAKYMGVYLWEWLNVLRPLLETIDARDEEPKAV